MKLFLFIHSFIIGSPDELLQGINLTCRWEWNNSVIKWLFIRRQGLPQSIKHCFGESCLSFTTLPPCLYYSKTSSVCFKSWAPIFLQHVFTPKGNTNIFYPIRYCSYNSPSSSDHFKMYVFFFFCPCIIFIGTA